MFESLEPRRLLAVTAFVHDGVLVVRGSAGDDSVSIFRGDNFTTFQLSAATAGEPTFDSLGFRTFSGVYRGISIDTGDGNDRILLQGLRVFGTVQIDAGPGDDQLIVRSSRPSGGLVWQGGDGNDSILIRKSTIQRDLVLDAGPGKDRTYLSLVHARQNITLDDTDGPSILTFSQVSVDGQANISTGASLDHLTIHDSAFKNAATITTSRGDDQIRVRGTTFRQTPAIDAGLGDNVIDREVILSWDFNNGAQAWTHGFADYPDTESFVTQNELRAGIKGYVTMSGESETGYELHGVNGSDDLLMFLTRQIVPADGLIVGRAYHISYDVAFATDKGREAVFNPAYLKVGGLQRAPRYLDIQRNSYERYRVLDADIGNQGNSGTNASIAGLIHNGIDRSTGFAITKRSHEHPSSIRADSQGRMWLFVGVDCAFEVPWTVFIQRIGVRLTPVN